MNPFNILDSWRANADASNYIKFGYNSLASATEQPVWSVGGDYPWSSLGDWNDNTGLTITAYSASTDDNGTSSPVGSGAQTIEAQGLGPNGVLQNDSVTLNGTTAVTFTKKFTRVFRAKVTGGNANAGKISLVLAGFSPDKVIAEIPVISGRIINQTLMAMGTVPAGYTAIIHSIDVSPAVAVAKSLNASLCIKTPADSVFRVQYTTATQEGKVTEFPNPLRLPQGTDIEVRTVWGSTTTTAVNCIINATISPNTNATAAQKAVIVASTSAFP